MLHEPDTQWLMGSFDLQIESFVQEHEHRKKIAQKLLSSKVTPQILDALKKFPSLYGDVMEGTPEYDVQDLYHDALCEETIDSDAGQQKNFLHFLLVRQVKSCDGEIWILIILKRFRLLFRSIRI